MKVSKKVIEEFVSKYKGKKDFFLALLQDIQNKYNYLPEEVLEKVCEGLDISKSKIFGLVTFYAQFSMEERGRYVIKLCEGTACHIKGSRRIKEALEENFKLQEGKTTSDKKFTLQVVACLGSCFLAPMMMVNSTYYGNLTPEKAVNVLKKLK